MKKRRLFLAGLALALALTTALPAALAYFSTNARASGGRTLRLSNSTHIDEEVIDWTKQVTITSEPGSAPVYLRVIAFCSDPKLPLVYSEPGGAGSWSPGADGYWYYGPILNGGETAARLDILINGLADPSVAGPDAEPFEVVVAYETTPVQYREDGAPYADWDLALNRVRLEGGAA